MDERTVELLDDKLADKMVEHWAVQMASPWAAKRDTQLIEKLAVAMAVRLAGESAEKRVACLVG
jgi:neutral trehalase